MEANAHATTNAAAPAPVRRVVEREEAPRCGVCGARERSAFYPPADIVECGVCRALYVSPRPTAQAIVDFYSAGGHYDHWDREPGRAAMWRRRTERIARLAPRRPDGAPPRLLDVGTGQGDFGGAARGAFDVEATEVSAEGARLARERHGIRVHEGDLLDLDLPRATFDVVTLWHVLEHVAEPRATVERCAALLRPGGVLAIAVPNTDWDFALTKTTLRAARQFALKRRPRFELPLPRLVLESSQEELHLTHFTLRTLSWLLDSVGLEVCERGLDDHSADAGLRARLEHGKYALWYRVAGLAVAPAIFAAARKV